MSLGSSQYGLAFAAAFAASVVATPIMRRYAIRRDVVDAPDGGRKVQEHAIPYLGGVAIAGSATVVLLAASSLRGNAGADTGLLLGVLGPALVLSLVGLVDDVRGLTPLPRFLVQGLAAAFTAYLMASAGTIGSVSGLFWLDAAVTMLWVVGITNALNLLDNTDGAASGTATIASLFFALIAGLNGQFLVAALAIALAGSCAGFLVWNRSPARIYMGDSGSLFIGFMLAAIAVRIDLVALPRLNALAVPVLVLAVPILDTSLVVASRIQRGLSPFVGGLDHVAHRIRRLGLSVPATVGSMWAAATTFGAAALAISQSASAVGSVIAACAALTFITALVLLYRLPATGDLPRS